MLLAKVVHPIDRDEGRRMAAGSRDPAQHHRGLQGSGACIGLVDIERLCFFVRYRAVAGLNAHLSTTNSGHGIPQVLE